MGSLYVGTMEGNALDVVEMMKRWKMEVPCVQLGDEVERRQGTEDGGGIGVACRRRRKE